MFKKNIFSKLFLMNLIILILLVISQLTFQVFLFEPYYVSKKEDFLKKQVNEFEDFMDKKPNEIQLCDYINEISRNNKVTLLLKKRNFEDVINLEHYTGSRNILVKSKEGTEYKIILDNYSKELSIHEGDRVEVIGVVDKYNFILPSELRINGTNYENNFIITPKKEYNEAIELEPATKTPTEPAPIYGRKLVNIKLDNTRVERINQNDNYYFLQRSKVNELLSQDTTVWRDILNNKDFIKKIYNDSKEYSNLLYTKNYNGLVIMAITPLSQVKEAIAVMNSYYLFIFLFSLILVILISLIYSKYISKPLVEMSNIADNIANSKFDVKYKVVSEDEIGKLGNSLNKISENLEESLSRLQTANLKLKKDMDIQRVQEEKRKEFIANISHELKTPITIIQGYINGIKTGIYSDEKYYNDILDETMRLDSLVKEMLEISRLESPTFKLKTGPFDLWGTFLKENDKLRYLLREKDLTIDFNIDEAIVYGDEKRISQVIVNLYTNAIKYTPKGEKIYINISSTDDDKNYIFSIYNTGLNLNKEELEKIWDSFYRGEKSRNKKYGGTGLGLAIVKIILDLHKSNFGVENKENSVRFYFSLEKCNEY